MAVSVVHLPPELYPSSLEASVEFNNIVHTSPYNMSEQIEERPGDRWMFKFSYDDLDRNEARQLQAFLLGLRGVAGRFYAKDYAFFDIQGDISGTPKVDGSANSGSTCRIKDVQRNRDIFKVGDYVKISGRLHMITRPIRSDASGKAELVFSPPMRTVPLDNATVEYKDFTVTCRLKDNNQGKRSSRGDLSNSLSFEAVEVF